jgi:hypothetical protein
VAAQKGSLLPTQLTAEMPSSLFFWILGTSELCLCCWSYCWSLLFVICCCWIPVPVLVQYTGMHNASKISCILVPYLVPTGTGTKLAPNEPREFCAFLGRKHVAAACFHPHIPDSVFRICFYWYKYKISFFGTNARRNILRYRVVL